MTFSNLSFFWTDFGNSGLNNETCVHISNFGFRGLGFRGFGLDQGPEGGSDVSGSGFCVPSPGLRVSSFGFRVPGF